MRRETLTVLWTGAFAVVMTGLVSGVWGGLLLANLATTPAAPWAAAAMALVLWTLWSYLGGRGPPASTQANDCCGAVRFRRDSRAGRWRPGFSG